MHLIYLVGSHLSSCHIWSVHLSFYPPPLWGTLKEASKRGAQAFWGNRRGTLLWEEEVRAKEFLYLPPKTRRQYVIYFGITASKILPHRKRMEGRIETSSFTPKRRSRKLRPLLISQVFYFWKWSLWLQLLLLWLPFGIV